MGAYRRGSWWMSSGGKGGPSALAGFVTAVFCLTALPCLWAQTDSGPDVPARETRRVFCGEPGPWGLLEYTRIAIEPPENSLNIVGDARPEPWFFKGFTSSEVKERFRSAGLTMAQLDMVKPDQWEEKTEGVTVRPPIDLVLNLNPQSRLAVYSVLGRYKENDAQFQPFPFRPELLDERLEQSGLSEKTVAGFKKLMYQRGNTLFFADAGAYTGLLPDQKEKSRFVRTISRRNTHLVKLKVSPETSVDQLEAYWEHDGRRKALRPLFESLTRVPGGCSIDLAHLLPPMARKRIYTFPSSHDEYQDANSLTASGLQKRSSGGSLKKFSEVQWQFYRPDATPRRSPPCIPGPECSLCFFIPEAKLCTPAFILPKTSCSPRTERP